MTTEQRLPNEIIVTCDKLIELLEMEVPYQSELSLQDTIEELKEIREKYIEILEEMDELDNLIE
tara:strand:+ start:286 stop:477 length:192 start_codon:yes stop_codon:yes gene_type:complete